MSLVDPFFEKYYAALRAGRMMRGPFGEMKPDGAYWIVNPKTAEAIAAEVGRSSWPEWAGEATLLGVRAVFSEDVPEGAAVLAFDNIARATR